MTLCHNGIAWLQEPSYCQGHKTRKRGRRLVAGIVRSALRMKPRNLMNQEL